jgi:hypothetical protein
MNIMLYIAFGIMCSGSWKVLPVIMEAHLKYELTAWKELMLKHSVCPVYHAMRCTQVFQVLRVMNIERVFRDVTSHCLANGDHI